MITWANYAKNAFQARYPQFFTGLIGAWVPSLGPTNLDLLDVSRRRNSGSLINMAGATNWQTSNGQYALSFADLSDDRVDINSANFAMSEGAVSVWVNKTTSTATGKDYIIWTHYTSTTDRNFLEIETVTSGVGVNTPKITASINNAGLANNLMIGPVITTNQWYHIVFQWKSGLPGQLFINGKFQVASVNNYTTVTATNTEQIGNYFSGNNLGFGGLIDDIARWNRRLSPGEINLLYGLGRGGWIESRTKPITLAVASPYPLLSNLQAVRGNTSANLSTNVNY